MATNANNFRAFSDRRPTVVIRSQEQLSSWSKRDLFLVIKMLQTESSWEIPHDTLVVRSLTGDPTKRRYHLIELALNVPIYRLEVVMPGAPGDGPFLRRFRFDDLHKALDYIGNESPLLLKIVQEPAFVIGQKAQLRELHSVCSAVDEFGLEILVIETDVGTFRVGSTMEDVSGPLSDVTLIWSATKHPNCLLLEAIVGA